MSNFDDNELFYTICVPKKSDKGFYRIQTTWNENEKILNIILLDNNQSFISNFTKNELKKQAEDLETDFKDYADKILLSLKNEANDTIFYYERKDLNFFIYKQNLTSMKIILIKFKLAEVNFAETVAKFIDKIRTENLFYKEKLEIVQNDNNILTKEKLQAIQKLKNFVNLKESFENDIYTKFILILNEKKKKIAKLLDMIKVDKTEPKTSQKITKSNNTKNNKQKVPPSTSKKTKIRKFEVISSSGDEKKVEPNQNVFELPTQRQENSQTDSNKSLDLLNICIPKRSSQSIEKMEITFNVTENIKQMSPKNCVENHSQDLEELFASNEFIMNSMNQSRNISSLFGQNENKSQEKNTDTLNFCTQDLLDRF